MNEEAPSSSIQIEEVKDEVPSLPEPKENLIEERKEEFLGLREEEKTEESTEEKKDENPNSETEEGGIK